MGVRCMVIAKKTPAGGRCGHTCYTDSRMELRNVVTSTGEAPARREESKNTFCLPLCVFILVQWSTKGGKHIMVLIHVFSVTESKIWKCFALWNHFNSSCIWLQGCSWVPKTDSGLGKHHISSMGLEMVFKSFKMFPRWADLMKMTSRHVKMWKSEKTLIDPLFAIFGIYGVDFPP